MLALCVYDEARGQPMRGQQAVARVVLNRCHRRYSSDGTIPGTILWPNQFSGFWFDAVQLPDGRWRYVKVCHSHADALARAKAKLEKARSRPKAWAEACAAAMVEMHTPVAASPDDPGFGEEVVLYYNPAVTLGKPAWAIPDHLECVIGDHAFYRS